MLSRSKIQINLRHRLTSLAAVFFVIYALADVSILQIYCGSEALGIPPDHHMVGIARHLAQSSETPCAVDHADCQQPPEDHEYDHQHQCFCWQNVVVVAFVNFDFGTVVKSPVPELPFSSEDVHTYSVLSDHFRPPRTA